MSSFSRRTLLLSTGATLLLAKAGFAERAPGWMPPPIPPHDPKIDTEWRHYAADQANTRYAPLDQINGANFNDLEVAWRFKTDALGTRKEYQFEATPLLVKGRLFLTAGARRDCIALDASTGEMLWMYRMDEGERAANSPRQLSGHGCSYWTDG
ncbi:MAG: pyrroloquinoline quinone-dependent dehydrogenase, partial [Sphingomonas sp.]